MLQILGGQKVCTLRTSATPAVADRGSAGLERKQVSRNTLRVPRVCYKDELPPRAIGVKGLVVRKLQVNAQRVVRTVRQL